MNDVDLSAEQTVEYALLEHALGNFVRPLVMARIGLGTWTPDVRVTSFEIRLPPDKAASIQLNGESTGWHQVWATRDVAEGTEIGPGDLGTREVEVDSRVETAYIRASIVDGRWSLGFRFGRRSPRSVEHLRVADEFLAAAHRESSEGRPRAAFTAAFHAAEHYAKAELFCYSLTADVIDASKKHAAVRSTYSSWAALGNTDKSFSSLLEHLERDRGAATYANSPWATEESVSGYLDTLDGMQRWVTDVVQGRGPRAIQVIAQRDVAGSTIVSADDVGLRRTR